MSEFALMKDLFLCPVSFDSDLCDSAGRPMPLDAIDKELHYTAAAADLQREGSKFFLVDRIPDDYVDAKESNRGLLHLRVIESPDRKSYIPLFASYQMLINIFGDKIHIGVVSFEDAQKLCLQDEKIEGIVIGPGQMNKIVNKETLRLL